MNLGQKVVVETTKSHRASRISVELKALQAPWLAWCKAAGLTPSEGIRQLVRQAVGGRASPPSATTAEDTGDPIEGLRRHEVRMTQDEAAALAAAAQQAGMSGSRYLVCLLRAQLMGQDYFGADEVEALAQSNRFLMGLATAMARAARDPSTPPEQRRINQAQIQFIRDLVDTHVRSVSALLTANSRRWRR